MKRMPHAKDRNTAHKHHPHHDVGGPLHGPIGYQSLMGRTLGPSILKGKFNYEKDGGRKAGEGQNH